MKNDRELLKELLEYFEGVMAGVEDGKPFEKRDVPDCSDHDLEFWIDMVIREFDNMMCTYSAMRNFIMRTNGWQKKTGGNMCCTNIKESLEAYEKYMSTNKQVNEYFDLHKIQKEAK